MKGVLVTGSGGFIGRQIVAKLLREEIPVVLASRNRSSLDCAAESSESIRWPVERDEECVEILMKAMSELRVDTVVHLAGVAEPQAAKDQPLESFRANTMLAVSVLEAMRRARPAGRAIIISTEPRPDDDARSAEPYFVAKHCAEAVARCYALTYRVPAVIARLATVYGPGDASTTRLLPSLMRGLARGDDLRPQRPEALIDLVHVDDVIDALMALCTGGCAKETYDVSSGWRWRVGDLARYLLNVAMGDPGAALSPRERRTHLHPPPGWAPRIELETGLSGLVRDAKLTSTSG